MTRYLTFLILRTIRRSRYLLLLIALLTLLVAYPFWGRDVVGLATFDIALWGVLLAGLWALHRNPTLLRIAVALAVVTCPANVTTYFVPTREAVLVSCLLDLALLVFVTAVNLSHVMEEGRVDADRIFGAVCGYLLIGLTWSLLYGALNLVQPGSFDLGDASAPTAADSAPHFADMDPLIYFSLVTLSTLGYGDIVAVTRAARSLAALEAIVGQLYMAVIVARLIGLHILARRHDQP